MSIITHEDIKRMKAITNNYSCFDDFCTHNHCRSCIFDKHAATMSDCRTIFEESRRFKIPKTKTDFTFGLKDSEKEERLEMSEKSEISMTDILLEINEKLDTIITILKEKN